jgi:hypothetical protein
MAYLQAIFAVIGKFWERQLLIFSLKKTIMAVINS